MFRKAAFFSGMILILHSVPCGVRRSFAQDSLTDFAAIGTYIGTRMKETDFPGTALFIVQGDQIVHLKAFGVADAAGRDRLPFAQSITKRLDFAIHANQR
jgi:hypothetical protein